LGAQGIDLGALGKVMLKWWRKSYGKNKCNSYNR
jgi:hypothetical protein